MIAVGDEVMVPSYRNAELITGTVVRIRNEAERSHHKDGRSIEVAVDVRYMQERLNDPHRWYRPDEVTVL